MKVTVATKGHLSERTVNPSGESENNENSSENGSERNNQIVEVSWHLLHSWNLKIFYKIYKKNEIILMFIKFVQKSSSQGTSFWIKIWNKKLPFLSYLIDLTKLLNKWCTKLSISFQSRKIRLKTIVKNKLLKNYPVWNLIFTGEQTRLLEETSVAHWRRRAS